MTGKIKILISTILIFSILSVSAYAKDTMFGPREDWLVAEDYIDDVFLYDYENNGGPNNPSGGGEELSNYVKDIILLGVMGYEENGLFESEKEVTEKQLAEIIIKLRYNGDSALTDYQQKYGSNKKATVKTALTLMVDALGYSDEIKNYGEDGYFAVASNLKLLRNIKYTAVSDNITKEQLATLIYNSLDVDLKYEVMDDYGYTSHQVAKGKSFLTETFKMTKVDGFFNGKEGINIYSNEKIKEGFIQIDRFNYRCSDKKLLSLFGKNVEGYAKYDDLTDKYDVVLLRENTKNSVSKTYNLKDGYINGADLTFDNEDGSEDRYTISDIEYAMYNGDYLPKNDVRNYFDGRNATVTFSSSDGGDLYNVAIIKEFTTYPVKGTNAIDKRIIFDYNLQYDSKTYLQVDSSGTTDFYDSDLNPVLLSDIANESVISFYQNSSKTYTEIIVSNEVVVGTVDGVSGSEYLLSDGNEYEVSPTYIQAVNSKQATALEYGLDGKFYISYDGRIADCQVGNGNSLEFGFLKKCGFTSRGSVLDDKKYGLKIFSSNGKWLTVELADKVKLDGKSRVEKEDVVNIIAANSVEGTLIRYGVNDEGKVNVLDTIIETSNEDTDTKRIVKKWTLSGVEANWSQGMSWSGCPGKITGSTIIFNIPNDLSKENLYTISTTSIFVQDSKYNVDFYSPDNFLRCAAAIVNEYDSSASLTYQGSHFMGVESVKQVYDKENDETTYKVTGWIWGRAHTKGEWKLVDNFKDYNAEMPKPGCVYRYILSGSEVKNLDLLVEDGNIPPDFAINTGASYERMTGTVTDIVNGYIKINVGGTEWVHLTTTGTYMSYSKSSKKFSKIEYSDIYVGERIYIYGAVENAGGMLVVRD